jgi:hypothetical protein
VQTPEALQTNNSDTDVDESPESLPTEVNVEPSARAQVNKMSDVLRPLGER